MKLSKKQIEITIMVFLFLLAFFIRMPLFDYYLVEDSKIYSDLAKNIFEEQKYQIDGEVAAKYPPFFPIVASIFVPMLGGDGAVKFVSILFSSLTISLLYFFLRKLKVSKELSVVISASLLFNPWFFYFTSILGLSEGLASFMVLIAFWLLFKYFKEKKEKYLYYGAVILGLGVITRIPIIGLLVPIYIYLIIDFLRVLKKRKLFLKKIKVAIIFFVISILPYVIWFVRNLIVNKNSDPYLDYIKQSLIGYPHAVFYYFIIVFPVALLLFTYYFILAAKDMIKRKKLFWIILVSGVIIHTMISAVAWDLVNHIGLISNPWSITGFTIHWGKIMSTLFAVRYYVTLLALMLLLSGFYMSKKMIMKNNIFRLSLYFFLAGSIVVSMFWSFGCVQNIVGSHIPIPNTFVSEIDKQMQIVDYIRDSNIRSACIDLNQGDFVNYEKFLGQMFEDVNIAFGECNNPEVLVVSQSVLDSMSFNHGLLFKTSGSNPYVVLRGI